MMTITPEFVTMARYLAFAAISLTIIRSWRDAWASYRKGDRIPILVRRQIQTVLLLGVLAYYIHTLFVSNDIVPTVLEVTLLNFLYAAYFFFAAIPRYRRMSDVPKDRF